MAETDTAEIQYIDGVKTLVPLGTISTIFAVWRHKTPKCVLLLPV